MIALAVGLGLTVEEFSGLKARDSSAFSPARFGERISQGVALGFQLTRLRRDGVFTQSVTLAATF
jgi:hypothetical protein